MEKTERILREDLKIVSGGERDWEHACMKCPKCGEWNDGPWYQPARFDEPKTEMKVTFTCKCGCQYTGSWLVPL